MNNTEALREAAQAVLDRWDSPQWAWTKHGPTADLMHALRAALAQPAASGEPAIDKRIAAIAADRDYWREQAAQPAPARVPPGWQLVPVEPTQAMLQDGSTHCGMGMFGSDDEARKVYAAMLAAAPTPQQEPKP